MVLMIDRKKY